MATEISRSTLYKYTVANLSLGTLYAWPFRSPRFLGLLIGQEYGVLRLKLAAVQWTKAEIGHCTLVPWLPWYRSFSWLQSVCWHITGDLGHTRLLCKIKTETSKSCETKTRPRVLPMSNIHSLLWQLTINSATWRCDEQVIFPNLLLPRSIYMYVIIYFVI